MSKMLTINLKRNLIFVFFCIMSTSHGQTRDTEIKLNSEKYAAKIKNLYRERNIEIRRIPRNDLSGQKLAIINIYRELINNAQRSKDESEFQIIKKWEKKWKEEARVKNKEIERETKEKEYSKDLEKFKNSF